MTMKIGIIQTNPTVGHFQSNADKIIRSYQKLSQQGADLILTGELALTGYSPQDLIFRNDFYKDHLQELKRIASHAVDTPLIIGCIDLNQKPTGRRFHNAAALCHSGKIKEYAHKCLLATYDVFDEDRYFEPAQAPLIFKHKNQTIGITICEDIWTKRESAQLNHHHPYALSPIKSLQEKGVDIILNLSASPWYLNKDAAREALVCSIAKATGCPVVYCNLVGGNDEILFDGQSIAASQEGKLIFRAPAFKEADSIINLNTTTFLPEANHNPIAYIHDALIMGIKDYTHKTGLSKAVLGVSGGLDSAVVTYLACKALGKEAVFGFTLPSEVSPKDSYEDAHALANNLEIDIQLLPIKNLVATANQLLDTLPQEHPKEITLENIQSRARALLLTAIANNKEALLLTTGNKSELAVGYCTLYGDMCGGLNPIGDLPKTLLYKLADYINQEKEIIPKHTLTKAPSAELKPNQKDEDTLPPYAELDPIIDMYIYKGYSKKAIIEEGYDPLRVDSVVSKIKLNEFKRRQAAPVLKVHPLAFGTGRRYPIAHKYI